MFRLSLVRNLIKNISFVQIAQKPSIKCLSTSSVDIRRKQELLSDESFNRIIIQLTDNEFNRESNDLFRDNQ